MFVREKSASYCSKVSIGIIAWNYRVPAPEVASNEVLLMMMMYYLTQVVMIEDYLHFYSFHFFYAKPRIVVCRPRILLLKSLLATST